MSKQNGVESKVREIRRKTRRQYSAEEKIRIVLEGLRGESSIAELCRKENINQNLYYSVTFCLSSLGVRHGIFCSLCITNAPNSSK